MNRIDQSLTEPPVDLHVHSCKSDGTLTPAQLVDYAAKKGLGAFALTDHDTVDGVEEAIEAALQKAVESQGAALAAENADAALAVPEVIPGVEFSTEYQGKDIHILGLYIDWKLPLLKERIKAFADSRDLRNRKMCRALQEAGIDISYEKLSLAFPGSVITRGHYAKYMLEHGYVRSTSEAFERYIGDHCKYFVPREKVTPEQAVQLILDSKGLPILAHPTLYHMGKETLQTLVSRLTDAGLVGIEAVYSTYNAGEERDMRRLASQNGLLISGGSDFHGATKPGLDLGCGYGGLKVPHWILEDLKAKRKELHHV